MKFLTHFWILDVHILNRKIYINLYIDIDIHTIYQSCRNSRERWNARIVCTDLSAYYITYIPLTYVVPRTVEKTQ